MRKFFLFFLFFLLHQSSLSAQVKRDFTWLAGYEGFLGIDTLFGINVLDFKNANLDLYKGNIEGISFESNSSSISSKLGKLLFYTGGCFIFNGKNKLIENGNIINEGVFRDKCTKGESYISGNASTIFLPDPTNENEYYLLHQRVEEISPNSRSILLYSKIDALSNDSLGAVTESNIVVMPDSILLGEMAAVKHADGTSWWVVVPEDESNVYNLILIDSFGIKKSHDQVIGLPIDYAGMGTGQCKFSSDGTKFARWTSTQQLLYAEFDRATGTFSNEEQINVIDTTFRGGVEFSPNSRFLYVASTYQLHQFDTWDNDIASTQTLVAEWDGYQDFVRTFFSRLQLTPDCRIFISLPGSHRFWHIVHNPNEKGIACNVEQRGLSLKTWTFNTMPYFPNYNLGALGDSGGYPCDSTKITVSSTDITIHQPTGFVYPNPTNGIIQIDMPPNVGELNFQLFDMAGKPIFTKKSILPFEEIQLTDVANGMYFYKIFDRKGQTWSGKVVITR